MKLADALNLLRKVCAAYKGNLQEHTLLQEALRLVEEKCKEDMTEE